MIKTKINEISSSEFEYKFWDANFGGIRFEDLNSTLPQFCVGWCHGRLLECRPKPESIAVLIKYGEGEYDKIWFHIEYEDMDMFEINENLFDGFVREEQV